MESAPQQVPKRTNPATWIILAIVVIIAVAAFIYYWQTTSTNTNVVANVGSGTNANTNASVNTNSTANVNTNSVSNINATIDTSEWKAFESTQYGFRVRYPETWAQSQSSVNRDNFRYQSFGFNPEAGRNAGYQINVYASIADLADGSKYDSLAGWIAAKATGPYSYPESNFLGQGTFEGLWPSADMTYSFFVEYAGKIYNVDMNWIAPESRVIDSVTHRPIFNDEEREFLSSFALLK